MKGLIGSPPRDHGVDGSFPIVAYLVQISVADTAMSDLECHVAIASHSAKSELQGLDGRYIMKPLI